MAIGPKLLHCVAMVKTVSRSVVISASREGATRASAARSAGYVLSGLGISSPPP